MSKFFGNAFSDNVIAQSKRIIHHKERKHVAWWQGTGRVLLLTVLLCVSLFVLIARLFQLTIIEGHSYRALSDENRTRELIRHAPRGMVLDRTGAALVSNIPQFRLLSPCSGNEQLCISRISEEEGKRLETNGLPAQHFLEVENKRSYKYPESTAHIVGYTGEINEQELSDEYYKLRKYLRGDLIGRTGIEAVFEEILRGRDGRELVEVDAHGKILRVLGRDPEISGENVTLSIDAELSQYVMNVFPKGKNGAVVVSIPHTGEVLALYSSPTFSLNDFSPGMGQKQYEETVENPRKPLFNRAIGGVYPPGSTYKIVSALAALETKSVTRETKVEDTGVITIGPFSFPNWYFLKYGKTDGMVDIVKGLARSNDIYFYKLGETLGISKMAEWSDKVGIGKLLGIELPGEASGLLPGPEWKNNYFTSAADIAAKHNEWYLGDTYHMSIGQGYLLTTPLHVNVWTNIIANGGYFCRPTIKKSSTNKLQTVHDCIDLDIQQETLDLITEGMRQACSDGGTAYPLYDVNVPSGVIPVACKTGTAEFGHPQDKTHAWITLFTPIPERAIPASYRREDEVMNEPEISVTVLVEEGGEGSEAAAPIARKILEYWFSK